MSPPRINVTPLIDVLLVLLIIFMVVAPLKPSTFKAKLPDELPGKGEPDPRTLVVYISKNHSLGLNGEKELGTTDEPGPLIDRLRSVFEQRTVNGVLDDSGNTVKVVFVKGPRDLDYGSVVKVIDAAKQAGAEPLALQLDGLD